MTLLVAKERRRPLLEPLQHLLIEDASWSFYERLLRELDDRAIRATFDNGRLELMSPLPEHETWKKRIGRLIETLTLELNIPIASRSATTFRRKDLLKGVEPDECYYIQNEKPVRQKKRLDLMRDPPPDLVVEIDITSRSVEREPIYAALGVPELWRFDGQRFTFLQLSSDAVYQPRNSSRAFPYLRSSDVARFVRMFARRDETSVVLAFRDWVRKNAPDWEMGARK